MNHGHRWCLLHQQRVISRVCPPKGMYPPTSNEAAVRHYWVSYLSHLRRNCRRLAWLEHACSMMFGDLHGVVGGIPARLTERSLAGRTLATCCMRAGRIIANMINANSCQIREHALLPSWTVSQFQKVCNISIPNWNQP